MMEVEEFVPSLEVAFPYPKPKPPPHQRLYKQPSGELYLLKRRPAIEECFCIEHGPSAELAYMRHIYRKDEKLYDKLQRTRENMAQRAISIIDHHCPNIDAKMDVLYAIDYAKRVSSLVEKAGYDSGGYKPLAPARACKVGTPLRPLKYGIQENVTLNPDLYPSLPKLRKIVAPRRLLRYGVTPQTFSTFYPPYERGLTEYEESYSITGMALMKNARYYLEPLPSSRLRANDFHS